MFDLTDEQRMERLKYYQKLAARRWTALELAEAQFGSDHPITRNCWLLWTRADDAALDALYAI